jgi:alkylhydroperoxidase family enzyme
LTRLSEGHTHESAYEALKAHFTEEEQVQLTLLINVINGWNRISIGFAVWADPSEVKAASQAVAA